MISDLFRSPCWSRKCLVRHPQFREHDYRGWITSPDPVLNQQKITRLCYDFLSQMGSGFQKVDTCSTRFLLCVDVCFRSTIWFANGKQKYQKIDMFFAHCRCLFSLRNWAHHFSNTTTREIQFIFTQNRAKRAARNLHICWQFSRSNRVWFFGPVHHLVFPILPSSNRVFSWTAWTSEQVSQR